MLDLFVHVKTAYEIKNVLTNIKQDQDTIDTPID